jgi:hypothetical protein
LVGEAFGVGQKAEEEDEIQLHGCFLFVCFFVRVCSLEKNAECVFLMGERVT